MGRPASAVVEQPPVKKIRRSSPAPAAATSSSVASPVQAAEEVKEVVNIKDDPEALASTSAVNPDDAGPEFGGEDYDESYDGYYEDDGTELGDGAEGADGTKGGSEGEGSGSDNLSLRFVRTKEGE